MHTETAGSDGREGYNYVDAQARNIYIGWYGTGLKPETTPEALKAFIDENLGQAVDRYYSEHPDKPLFIMEFGA